MTVPTLFKEYIWLINLLISILTALAAALGTASCVRAM